jgi:hypothetical protein
VDPGDRRPNCIDHARGLEAEHGPGRKREHRLEVATPDLRIGGTDSRGLDADTYLTSAWHRHRYVAPDEDIRGSVVGEDDGFGHGRSLARVKGLAGDVDGTDSEKHTAIT